VLLLHVLTQCLLVASRVLGPSSSGTAFQCQRSTALNKESWEVVGITTKKTKNFEEPEGGFRVGMRVPLDGEQYDVVGFSSVGWAPEWEALKAAAAARRAAGGGVGAP